MTVMVITIMALVAGFQFGDGRTRPREVALRPRRRSPTSRDGRIPQGRGTRDASLAPTCSSRALSLHRFLLPRCRARRRLGPTAAATSSAPRIRVRAAPSERPARRFPTRPALHRDRQRDPRSSSRSSSTSRATASREGDFAASRPPSIECNSASQPVRRREIEMECDPGSRGRRPPRCACRDPDRLSRPRPRGRRARAGARAGAHGRAHRRVEPARARGGARVRAGAGRPRRQADRSLLPRRRPVPGREQQLRVRDRATRCWWPCTTGYGRGFVRLTASTAGAARSSS